MMSYQQSSSSFFPGGGGGSGVIRALISLLLLQLLLLAVPCFAKHRLPFIPVMTATTTMKPTTTTITTFVSSSILFKSQSIQIRGGGAGAHPYDDDDSDEEERPPSRQKQQKQQSSSSSSSAVSKSPTHHRHRPNRHDTEEHDEEDDKDRRMTVPPRSRRPLSPTPLPSSRSRRDPPSSIRRASRARQGQDKHYRNHKSLVRTATSVAQKTASMTSTMAWTGMKTSGKAALYVFSPKHVTRSDIVGVWRLDQSVVMTTTMNDNDYRARSRSSRSSSTTAMPTSCAANIELTLRGDVIVQYHDPNNKNQTTTSSSSSPLSPTIYIFKERSWPQSCTIEFTAPAFQGPQDDHPVMMHYKATFRRKLAQPSIIKMVGHIYTVPSSSLSNHKGLLTNLGRSSIKKSQKVGTFVARRRLMKQKTKNNNFDYDDNEYDDDEYDEYDEYDDDDWEDDNDDDNDLQQGNEAGTRNHKKNQAHHDNNDYDDDYDSDDDEKNRKKERKKER